MKRWNPDDGWEVVIEGLTDEVIEAKQRPSELAVIFHNDPYTRTDAPIYEFCPPGLYQ
jgi:TolB-like protein